MASGCISACVCSAASHEAIIRHSCRKPAVFRPIQLVRAVSVHAREGMGSHLCHVSNLTGEPHLLACRRFTDLPSTHLTGSEPHPISRRFPEPFTRCGCMCEQQLQQAQASSPLAVAGPALDPAVPCYAPQMVLNTLSCEVVDCVNSFVNAIPHAHISACYLSSRCAFRPHAVLRAERTAMHTSLRASLRQADTAPC
jgi:hypothetical protein